MDNRDTTSSTQENRVSLLWPSDFLSSIDSISHQISPTAWRDLTLSSLIPLFTTDSDHQRTIESILSTLVQDSSVIQYRQDVVTDLLRNPQLTAALETLFPTIDALGRYSFRPAKDTKTLHEITYRMGELESIVNCIHKLGEVFQAVEPNLTSQGLRNLYREIVAIRENPIFQSLVRELPDLLGEIRSCASVTIGVNLDQYLHPVEATLLAVNEKKFTSPTLLTRLFGNSDANSTEGIAQLHTVPRREVKDAAIPLPINSELGWAVDPMMVPLFADLAKIIEKTTQPIVRRLKQYTEITSQVLIHLRQDLVFYLGAIRFIQRMEKNGLPMCCPVLAPPEERICHVEEAYNASLALHLGDVSAGQNLHGSITRNPVHIGSEGRIFILTGPNRGGKTTYMQGVGILQVLAQVGLYVPGTQARISPVDQLFTHFPLEEKPEADAGRFGEEARRLGEIFQKVTRHSLILLNESLASTYAGESLYIAQDVVRMLRRIGARAIYSTHLHELAGQVEELNTTTPGDSRIVSIVASPVEPDEAASTAIQRTFKVEMRPPLGRSYAEEIAAKYGISYEQLEKEMQGRGVLKA